MVAGIPAHIRYAERVHNIQNELSMCLMRAEKVLVRKSVSYARTGAVRHLMKVYRKALILSHQMVGQASRSDTLGPT